MNRSTNRKRAKAAHLRWLKRHSAMAVHAWLHLFSEDERREMAPCWTDYVAKFNAHVYNRRNEKSPH